MKLAKWKVFCAPMGSLKNLELKILRKKFASLVGSDHVVGVSHSFIATANAIRHAQAEPLFIDIESNNLNMSQKS